MILKVTSSHRTGMSHMTLHPITSYYSLTTWIIIHSLLSLNHCTYCWSQVEKIAAFSCNVRKHEVSHKLTTVFTSRSLEIWQNFCFWKNCSFKGPTLTHMHTHTHIQSFFLKTDLTFFSSCCFPFFFIHILLLFQFFKIFFLWIINKTLPWSNTVAAHVLIYLISCIVVIFILNIISLEQYGDQCCVN